ncbi:hypothetical protein NMG60_11019987 [Bertholletia excelsa]
MATTLTLLAVLVALISLGTPTNTLTRNQDLMVAIEEMKKANYFTFIMLINMVPLENLIQSNVTFLMPNDRMLAKTTLPEKAVSDFLLSHSIPSPLLFDYLEHIPTGSILPTSKPKFMLRVSNKGRRSFHLNNVQIISPNICTAGSSIRCHGIDGVVEAMMVTFQNSTLPLPTCFNNSSSPPAAATPPTESLPLPAPPAGGANPKPLDAPPPTDQGNKPQKSGSSYPLPCGRLGLGMIMVMASLMPNLEYMKSYGFHANELKC